MSSREGVVSTVNVDFQNRLCSRIKKAEEGELFFFFFFFFSYYPFLLPLFLLCIPFSLLVSINIFFFFNYYTVMCENNVEAGGGA